MKTTNLFLASLFVLICYIGLALILPADVFWSPDEGAKYWQMETLDWDGGMSFVVPYNGRLRDPQFQFYPSLYPYGHTFPQPSETCNVSFNWRIWFTSITKPFFSYFGHQGLYIIPLLSGWGIALLSGLIVYRYRPHAAPWAIFLVGFATPIPIYSIQFSEHTLATMLSMIVLWRIIYIANWQRAWPQLLLIGSCGLFSIALRGELLIFYGAIVAAILFYIPRNLAAIRTQGGPILAQEKAGLGITTILLLLLAVGLFLAPLQSNSAVSSYCPLNKGYLNTIRSFVTLNFTSTIPVSSADIELDTVTSSEAELTTRHDTGFISRYRARHSNKL